MSRSFNNLDSKIFYIDNRGSLLYNILMKYLKWTIPITAIFAILFVGLGIYVTQAEKPVQSAVNGSQVQIEPLNADKILSLVNAERAKVGVAPLVSDPRLVQSAQAKADDMVANNYYAHVNPATGVSGYTLIPKGICVYKSENINEAYTATEAVSKWMASKPHHDAMLDGKYTLTGVGFAKNTKSGWYEIVQHFCQQ